MAVSSDRLGPGKTGVRKVVYDYGRSSLNRGTARTLVGNTERMNSRLNWEPGGARRARYLMVTSDWSRLLASAAAQASCHCFRCPPVLPIRGGHCHSIFYCRHVLAAHYNLPGVQKRAGVRGRVEATRDRRVGRGVFRLGSLPRLKRCQDRAFSPPSLVPCCPVDGSTRNISDMHYLLLTQSNL